MRQTVRVALPVVGMGQGVRAPGGDHDVVGLVP